MSFTVVSFGATIGFALGMIGGGGSTVVIPSLWCLLNLPRCTAIGTAAAKVGAIPLLNLTMHLCVSNSRWCPAFIFACSSVAGALVGAYPGKLLPMGWFVLLSALILLAAAARISRGKRTHVEQHGGGDSAVMPWTVGAMPGLRGICGGFLIAPSLVLLAGMPIRGAIGSLLVAVLALSTTTAASYASSLLVNFSTVSILAIGCVVGGTLGIAASRWLAGQDRHAKQTSASIYGGTAPCTGYHGLALSVHLL